MKPPVDAPTSTARRPVTSMANASSAPCELGSAARHERGAFGLRRDDDRLGRVDLARGGGRQRAAHAHPARDDHVDCSGATGRESTPDELDIEASAHGSAQRAFLAGALRAALAALFRAGVFLAAAFFAGDFLAGAFFAGAFLAGAVFGAFFVAVFVAFGAPRSRRSSAARSFLVARPSPPSWRWHLAAHDLAQLLAAMAADLDQLVDGCAELVAGELTLGDQIGGQAVGLRPAELRELDAGFERSLPVG